MREESFLFCKPGEQNLRRTMELVLDLSVVFFIQGMQTNLLRLIKAGSPSAELGA